MRITIASDAWEPQTNGVVTTLKATVKTLCSLGHEVRVVSPQGLLSIPAPSYPEIRLAIAPGRHIARQLDAFRPHAIHIATEGPVGLAMRRHCLRHGLPFTTSYHTRYPEYLHARWPIPISVSYAWLRRFHGAAARTFISSESLRTQLSGKGFQHLHLWRRGVDLERFRPMVSTPPAELVPLARPIMAYMGRLAVEKNLESFLRLDLPGTKLVIGNGPQRAALVARYPDAVFTGYRFGDELAAMLACADVFVFPSLTDTFGLAMIEALACGVPVAAFPVPGPIDVIEPGVTGILNEDLRAAVCSALRLDRQVCARRAKAFTWDAATGQFLEGLQPIPAGARAALFARGSAMITRTAARGQPSSAGDAN
ncbi:MAG: glycosyltransferase family 4 protein [Steroidobacteraceae bacterium]